MSLCRLCRADCLGVVSNPLYADNCRTGATGNAIYRAREKIRHVFLRAFFYFIKAYRSVDMSNFGRYEDYFQTFYVKQLEQKRETHKKTNNPILLKQIKELENLLYKNWLIIIPEEKPKVSKQLEFEF